MERQRLGDTATCRGASCLNGLSHAPLPPPADQAPLVVQVHPARSIVPQGGPHSLRCQVSGSPPHSFYWSREDGRPVPSGTQQRHHGTCDPSPRNHPGGGEAQGWMVGVGCVYTGDSHPLPTRLRAALPQCPARRCRSLHLHLPQSPSCQHQPGRTAGHR